MGRQASRFVHDHYSVKQEAADLQRVFSYHLEGSGGGHPSHIDLTALTPPSKAKRLGRHLAEVARGLVSGGAKRVA